MDRVTAAHVFVTIVERGSMAGAADMLDMSRSMVSRYLSQMEGWAGARLLHRSTRSLSLTPAGEVALEHCLQLQELAEGLKGVGMAADQTPGGKVRISCAPSLADSVLVPFLQQYLDRFPAVSVDLQVSNQTVNMVEERIDLAIRITNALDPNLIARPLGQCRSVLCASPEYLASQNVIHTPSDLTRHNCLTYSHFGSQWQFEHKGEPVVASVSGNFCVNEAFIVLKAAVAGMGVGLLPLYAASPYLRSGALVQLLPDYQPETLGIYGVYRSRRHMSPALRALIDELVEHFSRIEI
ncbi:LysR family transcriptional regulator [Spongorhabdus nitratireducens]